MAKAASPHNPMPPPAPGWLPILYALEHVARIVRSWRLAIHRVHRVLIDGQIRSISRLRIGNTEKIEQISLTPDFWFGLRFYEAKDTQGRNTLGLEPAAGKGTISIGGQQFYLWEADLLEQWPKARRARGRPSHKSLFRDEAERRLLNGQAPPLLKNLVDDLADWFKEAHPDIRQTNKKKTIQNNISDIWHKHRPQARRQPKGTRSKVEK